MNEAQTKEMTTRGNTKQKNKIYQTYSKEIEKLTHRNMSYKTPEELREKIKDSGTKTMINNEIEKLRKSKNPEDSAKAEALASIGNALQRRKY